MLQNPSNSRLAIAVLALVASPAAAAELRIEITLPEIAASPYYRPYLAAWVEDGSREIKGTVAVWYDTRLRDNIGAGFLRNLRTWWRAEGEKLTMPADGISGPTRAPGQHALTLGADHPVLTQLGAGDYVLAVEVTREDGAREVLRAPFSWGAGENQASTAGATEITSVAVTVFP